MIKQSRQPSVAIETPASTRSNVGLYAAGLLVSVLLSVASYWINNGLLSPDGFLYIKTAMAFDQGGIQAAMAHYNWPFYPILIAYVHQWSGLNYIDAAFLLNTGLTALLFCVVLKICQALSLSKNWLWITLLLLAFFPEINSMRTEVLRGVGYQPFALLGVYFCIRYVQHARWHAYGGAILSFAVATLFRVEGLALLAVSPLIGLARTDLAWLKRLLAACWLAITLLFVGAFIGLLLHAATFFLGLSLEGRLSFLLNVQQMLDFVQHYIHHYQHQVTVFGDQVLGSEGHPDWYAGSTLAAGLVYYLINMQFRDLYIIFLLLPLYGMIFCCMPKAKGGRGVVTLFMVANLLILLAFLFYRFFINSRYAFQLNILLFIWLPFALRDIAENWFLRVPKPAWRLKKLILFICFSVMLILGTIKFFSSGVSKVYLREAGLWLNHTLAPSERVFTNQAAVSFYAERPGKLCYYDQADWQQVYDQQWRGYDYLALSISSEHRKKQAAMVLKPLQGLQPVQTFRNERGDALWIFKVPKRAEAQKIWWSPDIERKILLQSP